MSTTTSTTTTTGIAFTPIEPHVVDNRGRKGSLETERGTMTVEEITDDTWGIDPDDQETQRRSRDHSTEREEIRPVSGRGCDGSKVLRRVIWVAAVISAFITLVGGLVYSGHLQLGLTSIGMMSQAAGLYTMMGAASITFILSVVLTALYCCKDREVPEDEVETPRPRSETPPPVLDEHDGGNGCRPISCARGEATEIVS